MLFRSLGVVATYVFHYVLFGVLATRIGLGQLFIDLASIVAGRYAGGPAKVSIFGSAMFGMISGSSIANTVTVGSLTIPAMIRLGYPRHFAAAFGVPTVCLLGPMDPRLGWSDHPGLREMRVDLPCSPCGRRECPLGHHDCMRLLTVAEVGQIGRAHV